MAINYAEELVRNTPGLTAEELVSGRVYIEKNLKERAKKPLLARPQRGFKRAVQRQIKFIPRANIRPIQSVLTREQQMLQELFGGGERTFGTGQNLPKVEGILRRGWGLINNDDYGETGQMFGMRKHGN